MTVAYRRFLLLLAPHYGRPRSINQFVWAFSFKIYYILDYILYINILYVIPGILGSLSVCILDVRRISDIHGSSRVPYQYVFFVVVVGRFARRQTKQDGGKYRASCIACRTAAVFLQEGAISDWAPSINGVRSCFEIVHAVSREQLFVSSVATARRRKLAQY